MVVFHHLLISMLEGFWSLGYVEICVRLYLHSMDCLVLFVVMFLEYKASSLNKQHMLPVKQVVFVSWYVTVAVYLWKEAKHFTRFTCCWIERRQIKIMLSHDQPWFCTVLINWWYFFSHQYITTNPYRKHVLCLWYEVIPLF